VSENIVYQGAEPHIEAPTGDEMFEDIRALKNIEAPGEINISVELIKYGSLELWKEIHAFNMDKRDYARRMSHFNNMPNPQER
jgi:hypothetical protein